MNEQTIAAIRELADEARSADVVHAEAEPASSYYLIHPDGTMELKKAQPKDRAHEVKDVDSLVECTKRLATPEQPASVWVSRNGIVVLLDDFDRRDRVALSLRVSPQMKQLQAWSERLTWLQQGELVRILRNVFRRSVKDTATVEVFRRLKFRQEATGESAVEHGKASVGKKIEGQVTGTSALPEELTFREDAFDGGALGIVEMVSCTVEIDVQTTAIAISPHAGAVEAAWLHAERVLLERLNDLLADVEHVSVYLGSP